MRFSPRILLIGACLVGIAPLPVSAQNATAPMLSSVQDELVSVIARVKPSVVTVVCERPRGTVPDADDPGDGPAPIPSDPTTPLSSLGTGLVFRSDGLILTNYHVVKNATSIRVLFNADSENVDRVFAHLVGADPDADLAVIQVSRTNLPALQFADSDKVSIGQWAIAVGAPFDQPQTVTLGIISARGRHIDNNGTPSLGDYLQTDAAINPGNSGGPLLDLEGRVVGINTAILSPSRASAGIGFSIPSNTIQRFLPSLIAGKTLQRGFVGVQYSRLSPEVAHEFGLEGGLQIGALAQKNGASVGPAKEAGVREGDIITGVNGQDVSTVEAFRGFVSGRMPGEKITLRVVRPSTSDASVQTLELPLVLGDRARSLGDVAANPTPASPALAPAGLGLTVADAAKLSAAQKQKYGLKGRESGAVITQLTDGSLADEAELREGLRISRARVNGVWQNVTSAADWKKIASALTPAAHVLLQLRDGDDVTTYRVLVAPSK